jgi:tRNA U34 5-carboxymethylaminomethyl modifying enzyme MnmG/GidA
MNLVSYEESVKSLVKKIKQKRNGWKNLKKAYVNYNEYLAESIDKSMRYSEYVAENLSSTISYSEYISEQIK